jgi:hypothetical protein
MPLKKYLFNRNTARVKSGETNMLNNVMVNYDSTLQTPSFAKYFFLENLVFKDWWKHWDNAKRKLSIWKYSDKNYFYFQFNSNNLPFWAIKNRFFKVGFNCIVIVNHWTTFYKISSSLVRSSSPSYGINYFDVAVRIFTITLVLRYL